MHSADKWPTFPEWIVNDALRRYLRDERQQTARMKWLFSLPARTAGGEQRLKELCGFDWASGQCGWAFNEGLRMAEDRGDIPEPEFKRLYWTLRPDFRFWTKDRKHQLILESKAWDPVGGDQERQARKYADYLNECGCTNAAVVYLVPPEAKRCLEMLRKAVAGMGMQFGLLHWNSGDFFQKVGPEILQVTARSIVDSAEFLKRALKLVEGVQ